jgi:hypothetical protein
MTWIMDTKMCVKICIFAKNIYNFKIIKVLKYHDRTVKLVPPS